MCYLGSKYFKSASESKSANEQSGINECLRINAINVQSAIIAQLAIIARWSEELQEGGKIFFNSFSFVTVIY